MLAQMEFLWFSGLVHCCGFAFMRWFWLLIWWILRLFFSLWVVLWFSGFGFGLRLFGFLSLGYALGNVFCTLNCVGFGVWGFVFFCFGLL